MKISRLLLATCLALAAVVVVVGALAWGHASTVQADEAVTAPAAPQTLPMPWLSDDDVADAPYGFSPTVDGRITPGEYAGAGKITFPGYAGDVEVFLRQDAITLYIAFDSPDTTVYPFPSGGGAGPAFQVFLDTANDKAAAPQPDDFRLTVDKGGGASEDQGNGSDWGGVPTSQWTAAIHTAGWGWQAEFAVNLSKLGISAGTPTSIGLALAEVWTPSWPRDWYWPAGGDWQQPDTWGTLTSSSDWSTFYWKPGPWEDYAPSGVPDFDQMQVAPTFCGPFAIANSLWWFDSKFEPEPVGPPPVGPPATIPISDSYPLVGSYDPSSWDDHDPQNVLSLTMDLGTYFLTDQTQPGTHIYDMYRGVQDYLRDRGVWDEYVVTLVAQPEFEWIAEEVMRSEDVVLLLGFWEWRDPDGIPGSGDEYWMRILGHYVTVAGVDPAGMLIALSDPAQDAAEAFGLPAPSRVLSGTLIQHYPPHPLTPDPTIHNDAGNVSHDVYMVEPGSPSPGGLWWIPGYEPDLMFLEMIGANPNPRWEEPAEPYTGGDIHTEIEYALAVSPFTWKASGRWVEAEDLPPYHRRFQPYDDFAPSGVPDFDQRQDEWRWSGPDPQPWTYDGPVAAANSLWWFDSKFEYHGLVPPAITDTYPLIKSYNAMWDDHDPKDVGNNGTTDGLVEDLAARFGTDLGVPGTVNTMLASGLEQYLQDHELRQGYVITEVESPDFWWVAEEVERSEDVILLLGFWQWQGDQWVRLGGHYVTLPGVDKQGGFVAFSDPYWDRMELALPPREFTGQPQWTGRVGSDGDPPLGGSGLLPLYAHRPLPHTGVYTLHNDAANVSHDVYAVANTTSPGGVWGPPEYVDQWPDFDNFDGLNGEPTGTWDGDLANPVQTEVDWAVAVSPVADVWARKDVTPTVVVPGDWVTFTIFFANFGNTAEDVVVSDTLPAGLINATYTYERIPGGTLAGHDCFTWTVGSLHWQQGGTLTVTAQVDPDFDWPEETVVTNTAEIWTTTPEQYQMPDQPNRSSGSFTVSNVTGYGADVKPDASQAVGTNGGTVVYDFTVRNMGTVADSFNLSLADDDWPTELSTSSVGPLNPGVAAAFQVSVTVPATAVGATFDQASITARSVASTTVSDASVFTTTSIARYNMHVEPASASLVDEPGETVTYTLVVYNDGNITDTYDVGHTLAAWPVSLSTATVGPVGPWSNESFQAYVTIPGGALHGASAVVTVTATSKGAPSLSDDSVLTTIATTQPITRGVEVAPHTATDTADPGETVTYTVRVTNTGTVADVIGLSHSAPGGWTVGYSDNPVSLGAGLGTDVDVTVGIPSGASPGSTGVITVTATSQGDPTQDDAVVLTTNVSRRYLYLPVVLRDAQGT